MKTANKKKSIFKKGKQVDNFFDKIDCFGTEVPTHTLEGTNQVGTSIGVFFTFLLVGFMVFYGFARGKILVNREKPLITTVVIDETEPKEI
jgi:hypothetical protein